MRRKVSQSSAPPSVTEHLLFSVVGIGASAGGLDALEQLFRHMPANTGKAFVLISHLAPDHVSLLGEIIQQHTTMPVVEAQDQLQIAPNTIYIIPPSRNMEIHHGKLQLSIPNEPHAARMPINLFMCSLAEALGNNAIGIILSGTGSDGTLGLDAIMKAGGITLVQEPSSAKYDGMPSSAIRAGCARHVMRVEEMPNIIASSTLSKSAQKSATKAPSTASGLARILMQLRSSTGQDFSLYKKSTIIRRIERRMLKNGIKDMESYARLLKENSNEVHVLFTELLINVTSFFRDPEAFTVLQNSILSRLFKDKPEDYVIRVWVAGCASGEEAYSIAILLREWMDEHHQEYKVQIYGTDLDNDAIAMARTGLFPHNISADISPERLRRFFIKEDAGYRIKKEIRECLVFAVQNVIKDPPFTKLDLLTCRNLMIYLEPELQNRLIPAFHYALKPGGVLFLSPSESIGNHTELFLPIDRKWKFYSAIPTAESSRSMMINPLSWTMAGSIKSPEEKMKKTKDINFAEMTRRVLIQCFAPPSVVTDLKGEILYVHGETGKYLRPALGQPSLNIVEMAREGLELELLAAIHRAAADNLPTLNREIQVKTNGDFTAVALSVRCLPNPYSGEGLLLVTFLDVPSPPKGRRKRTSKPAEIGRIEELERELSYTRENLQATIEGQQASNEELKSTNEELQSTNEELQSTNEELETSKEELQSVNEELITVNAELQAKIEQLAGMQNDMKNLLDNINVGTVFLNEHLIIRRFTRDATMVYRLAPSDVGRPLADIKSNLENEDLLEKAQTVLETLVPYEQEIRTKNDTWYQARIQPYRTLDNVIEGVVMTFSDISKRMLAESSVQTARDMAESIVDTICEPLLVLDAELKVVSANRAFYQYFKVLAADTVGRRIYELGNRQWNIPALRALLEDILPNAKIFEHYEIDNDFPIIGHRKLILNTRTIAVKPSAPPVILLAIREAGGKVEPNSKP